MPQTWLSYKPVLWGCRDGSASRVPAVLPGDLSAGPNTHVEQLTITCSSSSGESNTLWALGHPSTHSRCSHIHTHMYPLKQKQTSQQANCSFMIPEAREPISRCWQAVFSHEGSKRESSITSSGFGGLRQPLAYDCITPVSDYVFAELSLLLFTGTLDIGLRQLSQ